MKILACDPGESFGYCVGEDDQLQHASTADMGTFVHALAVALHVGSPTAPNLPQDLDLVESLRGVQHVVIEDWQLYPWVMREGGLDYDKCRTARAIGAVQIICQLAGVPTTLQPAKIKETAQAAGVEQLYLRPLHENRHANDAMQHFLFFNLRQGRPTVAWAEEGEPVLA